MLCPLGWGNLRSLCGVCWGRGVSATWVKHLHFVFDSCSWQQDVLNMLWALTTLRCQHFRLLFNHVKEPKCLKELSPTTCIRKTICNLFPPLDHLGNLVTALSSSLT
eukprot:6477759-Amphidinium_carterae.1